MVDADAAASRTIGVAISPCLHSDLARSHDPQLACRLVVAAHFQRTSQRADRRVRTQLSVIEYDGRRIYHTTHELQMRTDGHSLGSGGGGDARASEITTDISSGVVHCLSFPCGVVSRLGVSENSLDSAATRIVTSQGVIGGRLRRGRVLGCLGAGWICPRATKRVLLGRVAARRRTVEGEGQEGGRGGDAGPGDVVLRAANFTCWVA